MWLSICIYIIQDTVKATVELIDLLGIYCTVTRVVNKGEMKIMVTTIGMYVHIYAYKHGDTHAPRADPGFFKGGSQSNGYVYKLYIIYILQLFTLLFLTKCIVTYWKL